MTKYRYAFTDKKISSLVEFSEASAGELKVFLSLLDLGGEGSVEELCSLSGQSASRVKAAIALWEEAGAIRALGEDEPTLPYGNKITEEFAASSALYDDPEMRQKEIAGVIRDSRLKELFEEIAALLGKPMLSPSEIRILAELSSQYGLSDEYIAMLAAHLSGKGALTVRALSRRAIKLSADGVNTADELKTYLTESEARSSAFYELRRVMGIFDRALAPTERAYFDKWSGQFGFGAEIVGMAYDISVMNTGKRSFQYMDTLLTDWKNNGCKTLSDCEGRYEAARPAISAEAQKKAESASPKKAAKPKERFGDFDPEEAMKRAIERSFGKKTEEE